MQFLERKLCILIQISLKFASYCSTESKSSLVQLMVSHHTDKSLISWTHDYTDVWHHMASLGHNELILWCTYLYSKSSCYWEKDWFEWLHPEEKMLLNSLAPGRFKVNFRWVIFKLNLVVNGWGISCETAVRWMSLDLTDDKSTLVQVMAWCHQATSHYLSQCWPRSPSPWRRLGAIELKCFEHICENLIMYF